MKRFPFKAVKTFLSTFDNKFVRINWGGCAVSAAIIAKHLINHVDELKIVAFDSCDRNSSKDIDSVRQSLDFNTVRCWNEAGIAFSHIWVEFKWLGRWYAIDSEGLHSRKKMYKEWGAPFKGSFSLEEMTQLGSRADRWNCMFDREQIPGMKKFVKTNLEPILQAA